MRISSVTAHAFGPFAGQTLELAEGLTVIVGDNESGKSSWHAAIYAALCGRKRGRGAATIADREFERQHQPWSGDKWLVTAMLTLDDGRTIEMRQDLDGKVDCSATDAATGRDVSNEIMFEGAPDASRWLGLDRTSFVSTACVGQANLLAVREGADGLQSYLQRAATSAKAGGTAAGAIDLIKGYHRDHVGLDRANAVKPLRLAVIKQEQAVSTLAAATADHAEYLARVDAAEQAAHAAATAERELRQCEAVVVAAEATRRTALAERASALHAACGGVAPTAGPAADALDEQVLRAVSGYDARPEEPAAVSPSVAEIDRMLAELPEMPEGDTSPSATVTAAVEELRQAQMAARVHDANRPADNQPAPLAAVDGRELLELAHTLGSPVVDVPAAVRERVTQARAAAAPARGSRRTPLAIVGGLALVTGVGLATLGQPAVGVVAALVGVLLLVIGLLPRQSRRPTDATVEVANALAALRAAEEAAGRSGHARAAAVARCAELGVEPEPARLQQAALAVANAAEAQRSAARWSERAASLAVDVADAAVRLRTALAERGATSETADPDAVLETVDQYVNACTARAEVASSAGRRSALTAERELARRHEERAALDRAARDRASADLAAAAAACGIDAVDEQSMYAALLGWRDERAGTRAAAEDSNRAWTELQTLLDGRTVDDLQADAARALEQAAGLSADLPTTDSDPDDAARRLASLRLVADEARLTAARATTGAREFAERIASVADAEEALASAEAELARVRGLGATLARTQAFLEAAEAEVHRSIAPQLNESLNQHLATVTAGRYTEARVDPEHLSVKVCGSSRDWRPAEQLSFGTNEQIYLLLRAALADHLTRGHDSCPLILDDVTVHADAERKVRILTLLHGLSKDRQVIVFTQESQVAEWARQNLTTTRDAVRELARVPVA